MNLFYNYTPSQLEQYILYNRAMNRNIQQAPINKVLDAKINQQDEIQVIDDPVQSVRKLPDVYIGALGDRGFLNMFREILQNSLDEIIKGNTLNKEIIVSYDSRIKITIIEDNGQGIDLDKLAVVYSVLHSSSNYDKVEGSGRYSSGKNGMGGTITNFLSEFFIAESYRMDGKAAKVEFEEGYLKKSESIKCPKNKHGLTVTFKPSTMMGEISINEIDIGNLISLIVPLCAQGTRIIYNSIDDMGQKKKTIIENKNGIYDLMDNICEKKVFMPIHYIEDNGTMKVDVLFSYDVANMDEPKILGFANMCPTDGGEHIDGFLDAIVKYFRDYMNKIYLANNKKKLQVVAQDIRTGLRAVVSIFHLFPMFTGQSKEIFSKKDIRPYIYNATLKALDQWAKSNPTELQRICKYIKEVCQIRTMQDGEKVKMSDKYVASAISGLPEEYEKPILTKGFEIMIVEGKSAKSGAVNNRDKRTQGLFPIRGKMPNAFTTPTKKYFENAEVAGLFKIFGYNGYSKKFDPAKFKPSKVIIMTDADADGAHIRTLVFGMFLVYLPFVIEQGMLYFVEPPLYGVTNRDKSVTFFRDNKDFVQYIQDLFTKTYTVHNINTKKPYNKKDLTNILVRNIEYVNIVNEVANTYSINPKLLEFILFNINNDFKKFKSAIEKNNRFLKVTQENGTTMVRGLYESEIHTIFINDRLLNDCSRIVELINHSENYYMVGKDKLSLYDLMKLFESFKPNNVARYKGLGEMTGKLLGQSTILPGQGRTLKQYTIDDAKKQLAEIRELQSDKAAFMKGVTITREDIV